MKNNHPNTPATLREQIQRKLLDLLRIYQFKYPTDYAKAVAITPELIEVFSQQLALLESSLPEKKPIELYSMQWQIDEGGAFNLAIDQCQAAIQKFREELS